MVESVVKELALTQRLLASLHRNIEVTWNFDGMEGLNAAQDRVMKSVYDIAPCVLSDVAGNTGLSMPAASIAIKKLTGKGLLETTRDPDDRRKLIIRLSAAAKEIFDRQEEKFLTHLRKAWMDCDEIILAGLLEELRIVNSKLEK